MKIIKRIKISENGFIFNSGTGDSFSMNSTGLELIKLISQGKEMEEIKEEFINRSDVDDLTFEKDFYEFCTLLKLYEIIEEDHPNTFN